MASEYSLPGFDLDLEILSEVEGTFHFPDYSDFRTTLRTFLDNAIDRDSLCDHTVLITGFPTELFMIDEDDDGEESPLPKSRKALYFEDSKILVLTMPGAPHEVASRLFDRQLQFKLKDMNCLEEGDPTGGVTMALMNVKKEPDESWSPKGTDYLTFAVESGVSEGKGLLHRDVKIWLEHPESHVKQVVTIKIDRPRPEIVFTVWKTTPQERATRAQHPPRAIIDHEVCVTLEQGRPIADGNIYLSFEEFFERRPRLGTTERDMVFSGRELGGIARAVWSRMGFIQRE